MNLNKVVLVTGGTKGIGYETAKKFALEGYRVYSGARTFRSFDIENIEFIELDVSNRDSCKKAFDYIIAKEGRLDVLVANAGITSDALTLKMTEESFDRVINTNLKGIFNIVQIVGPYMETQGKGSIITISSVVGEFGNIGQANYAASKAGVIGMSKSWAKEFARKGVPIRVNVVCPGYIMTDMLNSVPDDLLDKFSKMTMLKRLGQPSEVAEVVFFLGSDKSSYITGTVIDVNGGMRL